MFDKLLGLRPVLFPLRRQQSAPSSQRARSLLNCFIGGLAGRSFLC